jgi:hypothetical protein
MEGVTFDKPVDVERVEINHSPKKSGCWNGHTCLHIRKGFGIAAAVASFVGLAWLMVNIVMLVFMSMFTKLDDNAPATWVFCASMYGSLGLSVCSLPFVAVGICLNLEYIHRNWFPLSYAKMQNRMNEELLKNESLTVECV